MTGRSPQAPLEYRFESSHDLDELAFELSGSPDRWLVRACPDPYLTTLPTADPQARGRIDAIESGAFRFTGWSGRASAEALWSRVAAISGARVVVELPAAGGAALRECGAFQFDSALSPEVMERALAGSGVRGVERGSMNGQPILHWASSDAERLEEVMWLVRLDHRRPTLEVIYDGNPHDEARWRSLCAYAFEVVLPALQATAVDQPRDFDASLRAVSRHRAWSFSNTDDLAALGARLWRASGLGWIERDSTHYGDYLSAHRSASYAERVRLRVFEDAGSYTLDLRWQSMHPEANKRYQAIERWVLEEVLPAADAAAVADAESHD